MTEFIRQFVLTTLVGFIPFVQSQQADLVLTMGQDGAVSLEETARIISTADTPLPAPRKTGDSVGVEVGSVSALLLDAGSGQVLWQKNADQALPIASLTKLMTLQIVLDHQPDWNKEYSLQPDENALVGAKLREPDGVPIRVDNLFGSALVGSANNATLALARSTGLPDEQFVTEMNGQAAEWGLATTHFLEPTGLDESNVSTAREYARIARQAFARPEIRALANQKYHEFTISANNSQHKVTSTNKILDSYLQVIGTKTGFTYEAGYCLATLINSNGHELLVVVLGNPSDEGRITDTKSLVQWAENNFQW